MNAVDRIRNGRDAVRRFDAECGAEDARQLRDDMRELMKVPAFVRTVIAFTRRWSLEKSIAGGGSEYAHGVNVGLREAAVQIAEAAKHADFDAWQKGDRERWAVEQERAERKYALENGN